MSIKYLYIETTNHCNLNCVSCNRQSVIGKLQHMSLDKFDLLIDQLKHEPVVEAKLMGMGEPFLHPQFSKIVRNFKQVFPHAKLISATNAQYLLTQNMADSLKYIDELYISVDGAGDNYERLRPPAKWSKLISFLTDLQNVNRYNCNIVINCTVSPGSVFDIPLIEELAAKYNIGPIRLNLVQNWNQQESINSDYTAAELLFLHNYKDKIKGKAPWTWSDCMWVKEGFYSTVEGNIKVCCMNTSAESLGNIFEIPLSQIHNKTYDVIKQGCHSNNPTDHCKTCSYKQLSPLLESYL